jgi:2-polyprenyl-3-methyl-5-hydroxy-6-metoxy-1,4-benzoquinol methylase
MDNFLKKLNLTNGHSIVDYFFNQLLDEFNFHKNSEKYLNKIQTRNLIQYYRNYNRHTIEQFSYYYGLRSQNSVDLINNSEKKIFILDAGCGLGSMSIFFSLLGAEVYGIDLSKNRIEIANRRVKYYEKKFRTKLNVNFQTMNIFKFKSKQKLDLIFANEFISHVDPLELFLQMANNNLRMGGYLNISDTNNNNPYARYKAWRVHRREGLCSRKRDPNSNEEVSYLCERLLTINQLRNEVAKNGFNVNKIKTFGFLPQILFNKKLFKKGQKIIGSIPIIKNLGVIFDISSVKIKNI